MCIIHHTLDVVPLYVDDLSLVKPIHETVTVSEVFRRLFPLCVGDLHEAATTPGGFDVVDLVSKRVKKVVLRRRHVNIRLAESEESLDEPPNE